MSLDYVPRSILLCPEGICGSRKCDVYLEVSEFRVYVQRQLSFLDCTFTFTSSFTFNDVHSKLEEGVANLIKITDIAWSQREMSDALCLVGLSGSAQVRLSHLRSILIREFRD